MGAFSASLPLFLPFFLCAVAFGQERGAGQAGARVVQVPDTAIRLALGNADALTYFYDARGRQAVVESDAEFLVGVRPAPGRDVSIRPASLPARVRPANLPPAAARLEDALERRGLHVVRGGLPPDPAGGADTGYVGVQRGTAGQMNLVQIGGGQNTFGTALPPGTGVGESADIIPAVGQTGPQVVASGSFTAPAAQGTYAFSLTNAIANVITELNAPPAFSPVADAGVDVSAATFSFTVTLVGDLDGDGCVDLSDLATLLANYGTASGMTYEDGDIDGDGDVDLSDLAELLAHYGEGCE